MSFRDTYIGYRAGVVLFGLLLSSCTDAGSTAVELAPSTPSSIATANSTSTSPPEEPKPLDDALALLQQAASLTALDPTFPDVPLPPADQHIAAMPGRRFDHDYETDLGVAGDNYEPGTVDHVATLFDAETMALMLIYDWSLDGVLYRCVAWHQLPSSHSRCGTSDRALRPGELIQPTGGRSVDESWFESWLVGEDVAVVDIVLADGRTIRVVPSMNNEIVVWSDGPPPRYEKAVLYYSDGSVVDVAPVP